MTLLGNSDSGKRELYSYLNKDSLTVNFISTIGVDFAVKKVKVGNRTMKAEIWDAGMLILIIHATAIHNSCAN